MLCMRTCAVRPTASTHPGKQTPDHCQQKHVPFRLQALGTTASSVVEARSRGWMPLFLEYSSARSEQPIAADDLVEEEEEDMASADAGLSQPSQVAAQHCAICFATLS